MTYSRSPRTPAKHAFAETFDATQAVRELGADYTPNFDAPLAAPAEPTAADANPSIVRGGMFPHR